jgi:hypothetical protein
MEQWSGFGKKQFFGLNNLQEWQEQVNIPPQNKKEKKN